MPLKSEYSPNHSEVSAATGCRSIFGYEKCSRFPLSRGAVCLLVPFGIAALFYLDRVKERFLFLEVYMAERKLTREDCLALLREKYSLLNEQGENRYPKRSDFSEAQVVAIKAFLGPWPRALEAAGVKPPRQDDRQQKNKEKRIRAKQKQIAKLKEQKAQEKAKNAEGNS